MLCPFEDMEEDDEDDQPDERRIPIAIPMRRAQEGQLDNLSQFPVIAHGDPAMRKALEKMAAIQREGGLKSIPRAVPSLPFGGRGHPELISILAAIAVMTGLKALRSTGFGASLRAVRLSETRAAKGLTRLSGIGGQPTGGRGGGLHVQAPTFRRPLRAPKVSRQRNNEMKRLLGFGPKGPGFDQFSETGFF